MVILVEAAKKLNMVLYRGAGILQYPGCTYISTQNHNWWVRCGVVEHPDLPMPRSKATGFPYNDNAHVHMRLVSSNEESVVLLAQ